MTIRSTARAFLASLLLGACAFAQAVPFLDLGNGTEVYNTGVDVVGGVDQHYRLTSVDGNTVDQELALIGPASFLAADTDDSKWVGHAALGNPPNVVYGASTVINLTGFDLVNNVFSIDGSWISDNRGVDIRVNGVSTGQTNSGQHGRSEWALDLANDFSLSSASSGLIAGMNTVEFLWENGTPEFTNPSPTMVRVQFEQFSLTPTQVPAPAVPFLLATAFLRLGAVRRR